MLLIAILAGVAAVAIAGAAPFLLSWPHQLRWLLAVSAVPDPWGFGPPTWPNLEELTVTAVISCPDGVIVDGTSWPPARSAQSLWLEGATDEATTRLEWWAAEATPLLELRTIDGEITLHGPTSSVAGLHPLSIGEPRREAVNSSYKSRNNLA